MQKAVVDLEKIMVKEGIPFFAGALLLSVAVAFFGIWILAGALLLLSIFMGFFFRDPERNVPEGEGLVVSAADGKVTKVESREEGEFVSVFLSPFDVHINRAPIGGTVTDVRLFKGKKAPATSNEASKTNERNAMTIEDGATKLICTQIVGIVARRIVCWRKPGDTLKRGERYGLIKFGSRTDLLLPKGSRINVSVGDRVRGGETIIGKVIE